MFFQRKHFIEWGYKVMGLDFNSNHTCNHYVKYFPEKYSMVVCSTIFNNKIMVYRLTPEQYKDFHDGKFALSHQGQNGGTTPSGYPVKDCGYINVFSGDLKNRKSLKQYLDQAEVIASN
jgi:hypothetical protein